MSSHRWLPGTAGLASERSRLNGHLRPEAVGQGERPGHGTHPRSPFVYPAGRRAVPCRTVPCRAVPTWRVTGREEGEQQPPEDAQGGEKDA